MQEIPLDQDKSSPAITVPNGGLPFDNSVQTQAFVSGGSNTATAFHSNYCTVCRSMKMV